MRRVLVISSTFPPVGGGAVLRLLKTIKYLPAFGWEVTVLTTDAPTELHYDHSLEADVAEGLEVARIPSPLGRWKRPREGGVPRASGESSWTRARRRIIREVLIPDAELPWAFAAARAARRTLASGRFDAVFTTSPLPSNHLAARLALGERGHRPAPWLADLRDPWVRPDGNLAAPRALAGVDRALERICVGSADGFVTVNDELLRLYERRYPALRRRPRAVVPNGFDPDDYAGEPAALPAALADLGARLDFVNTGRFYPEVTPEHGLTGALHAVGVERPEFARDARVFLIGPRDPLYEPDLSGAAPVSVARIAALPYRQAVASQRRATVLILLGGAGRLAQATRLKLYEYLASRRPILAQVARGGELERFLRARSHVKVAAVEDGAAALVPLLRELHDEWRAGRLAAGEADDLGRFSRRTQTGEIAGLLDRLVEGR